VPDRREPGRRIGRTAATCRAGSRCSDSRVENSLVRALSNSKGGVGIPVEANPLRLYWPVRPQGKDFLGFLVGGRGEPLTGGFTRFSPHRVGLVVAEEGEHGGHPSVESGVSGVKSELGHDVVDVLFH
jgi:hypothetical protein